MELFTFPLITVKIPEEYLHIPTRHTKEQYAELQGESIPQDVQLFFKLQPEHV